MVTSEAQLREKIADYLVGRLTLAQLQRELPDGWELDEAGDAALRELALQVMGVLAEFDRGDIGEEEVRARLLRHVGWIVSRTYSVPSGGATISAPRGPARAFEAGTALPAASA